MAFIRYRSAAPSDGEIISHHKPFVAPLVPAVAPYCQEVMLGAPTDVGG